jgi:tRNA(fMet)-specific endonuclease VapC
MRFMLDTNICIYAIKKQPEKVFAALSAHEARGIGISSISVAELWYGVAKSESRKNATALREFLASLEIVPFDENAAERYGMVRAQLEAVGKPIGPLDMQIAAHALTLGVTLVSNNLREFQRVEGLKLANWAE